jgi:putative transposase
MGETRYSVDQIVAVLKESDAGASTAEPSRRRGISKQSVNRRKEESNGMDEVRAQRLSSLEDENRRLKRVVAELTLDLEALKGVILRKP